MFLIILRCRYFTVTIESLICWVLLKESFQFQMFYISEWKSVFYIKKIRQGTASIYQGKTMIFIETDVFTYK